MSEVNQSIFDHRMQQISSVVTLIKLIGGLLCVCGTAIGYGFVWINQTTTAIARSQQQLTEHEQMTAEKTKEWLAWRSDSDKVHGRIIAVQESQTRILDRMADKVYSR